MRITRYLSGTMIDRLSAKYDSDTDDCARFRRGQPFATSPNTRRREIFSNLGRNTRHNRHASFNVRMRISRRIRDATGGDTPFLATALRLVPFHYFTSLFIACCNRCGGQLPGARECGRSTARFTAHTSAYDELIAKSLTLDRCVLVILGKRMSQNALLIIIFILNVHMT